MSICLLCDRTFPSYTALQQHERDSPAHAESFDCGDCSRSFSSGEALAQHLRDSPAHQRAPETPLDIFFRSFPTFAYDPSQPPATSYASLQDHEGWRRGDTASDNAWNLYQNALEDELRLWFGKEDDLAAWHALCHAIGVEPPPQTCGQCEEVWVDYTWCGKCMLTQKGCSENSRQYCRPDWLGTKPRKQQTPSPDV